MQISYPVQSVLYAVVTKSVGSGFRVADDWSSPPEKLAETAKREGILLLLTTALTTGIQVLFTRFLSTAIQKSAFLARHDLLMRAAVTAPVLIFAEWLSRAMAPRNTAEVPPPVYPPNTFYQHSRYTPFTLPKTTGSSYHQDNSPIHPGNFYS